MTAPEAGRIRGGAGGAHVARGCGHCRCGPTPCSTLAPTPSLNYSNTPAPAAMCGDRLQGKPRRADHTSSRRPYKLRWPHTAAAALLAPMCAQYRKGVHQAKRPAWLSSQPDSEPVAPPPMPASGHPSLSQPHPYQAPARAWLNIRPSRARLTGRRRRSDRRPARSPAPRHQRLSCSRRQSSRRQRRLPRQNPSRRLRCYRVRERG